jgi:chloride channel protein, CIC family
VVGVAAAVFVRSLHWAEDGFDKVPGRYLRHMLGMLLVGALIYALMRWGGHYYVEGVGYATIQATLTGQLAAGGFLLLLYVCKLCATSVSLGSVSSGGIFSPSLFMGATLVERSQNIAYNQSRYPAGNHVAHHYRVAPHPWPPAPRDCGGR